MSAVQWVRHPAYGEGHVTVNAALGEYGKADKGKRKSVAALEAAGEARRQSSRGSRASRSSGVGLQVEQPVWVKFDKGKKKGLSEGFHRHELAQLDVDEHRSRWLGVQRRGGEQAGLQEGEAEGDDPDEADVERGAEHAVNGVRCSILWAEPKGQYFGVRIVWKG